jgi:hypothetical protein
MLYSLDLAPTAVYNVTASVHKTRDQLKYLYHALTAAYLIFSGSAFSRFISTFIGPRREPILKVHVILGCQYTGIMGLNPKSGVSFFSALCWEAIYVLIFLARSTDKSAYNTHGKNKSPVHSNTVPWWAGGWGLAEVCLPILLATRGRNTPNYNTVTIKRTWW